MIQAIELTAKIRRCQTSAKFMLGDSYNKVLAPYISAITAEAKGTGDNLKAVLKLAELPTFKGNGYVTVLLMAAYAEVANGAHVHNTH